jgi:hypothetical protein
MDDLDALLAAQASQAQSNDPLDAALSARANAKGGGDYQSALRGYQQQLMDSMPWWQRGLAGAGKAFVDMGRGVGQLLPGDLVTRANVDESRKLDAPLMNTGMGIAGNVVGNLAPLTLAPVSGLAGLAGTGAALGFTQPVGTKDSRTLNTAIGVGSALVPPALIGTARAGMGLARGLAEPVYAPQQTAMRIIDQFANDPAALRSVNPTQLVPNSAPTLGQVAQQPGISTLERSVFNQPGPAQAAMTDRMAQQTQARAAVLNDLAGTDGRYDFMKSSRDATAQDLYAKAFAQTPDSTPWIQGQVTQLMKRPSFVDALKDGQRLALDSGIEVSPNAPENTTQILHFTKMALDDKIEAATRKGSGNSARALIDARDKLVSLMESKDFSPSYREARDTFKQMSQPVNEMEVSQALLNKATPALQAVTSAPQTQMLSANLAAEARRQAPAIAKFSPDAQAKLQSVLDDARRANDAQSLGKPLGSPTAQFLTAQNLMRQIAGPVGVPSSFSDRVAQGLLSTPGIGPVVSWATKGAENRVQQELADLLLNPGRLRTLPAPKPPPPSLLSGARAYLPALTARGLLNYSSLPYAAQQQGF